MKLLQCLKCNHIFSLDFEERICDCKATKGRYINDQDAVYSGEFAIPLGFANSSFLNALQNQPLTGLGELFTAFVIPKTCPTFINEQSLASSAGEDITELIKDAKHEDEAYLPILNFHNQKSPVIQSIKLLKSHLLSNNETVENLEYYLKEYNKMVSEQERKEILVKIAELKEANISYRHAIDILGKYQMVKNEDD